MINHKGIEHNVYGEAPFVGARICAMSCHKGCVGCQHDYLKGNEVVWYTQTAEEIVGVVHGNLFNQGLILGGLEWTEQPEQMVELVQVAMVSGLEVIVYTHKSEHEMRERFGKDLRGAYIKVGEYRAELSWVDSFGVRLASSNQSIILL